MATKATPLGLRLFLEGVEVPVISAQVTILPDQPATAAIQIVPSDMALCFLPRTLVHLFYLDDEPLLDSLAKSRVNSGGGTGNTLNQFDAPDAQYKLLFPGEIIGFNYGKNPSSRQLVLQCMDLSSYWNTCYQWFADYSVGGNGLTDNSHNFTGAGKTTFNSIAGGHQWVIGRILNTKPRSAKYQKTQGLLSGIIHLLEAIGGLRYQKDGDPGFNGVNDFFTIAELRYNLLGMIGAVEKDTTTSKMYASKAFRSWLRNGMTSLGTLLSFRDIVNHVSRHIFHHIYPNPCAYYVPPGESREVEVGRLLFTDTTTGKIAKKYAEKASQQTTAAQNFFASTLAEVETEAVASLGPTIFLHNAQANIERAQKNITDAEELVGKMNTDDRSDVLSRLSNAKSMLDDLISKVGRQGREPKGDFTTVIKEAFEMSRDTVDTLGYLLGSLQRVKNKGKKSLTVKEEAHLYTQLIFPETFFVSPPRCNVIFPDQYFQFSFSRNFMREVTRLNCKGGLGMIAGGRRGAKLLGRNYYAPNITDIEGNNLYATMARGGRIILPHEVHSGIIPKFEWVTDGHRWASKAAKETGKIDDFHKSGKVGYVQRLANFQFYIHRWASRTMSINGVFNPHLVLGLPALVLDRAMPAPAVLKKIEAELGRRWLPTQYLGKLIHIAHNIHQQGGGTSAHFSHCRTHRGVDDEFLGVLVRKIERTKGKLVKHKFTIPDLLGYGGTTSEEQTLTSHEGGKSIYRTNLMKYAEDYAFLAKQFITGKLVEGKLVPSGSKIFSGLKVVKIKREGKISILAEEAQTKLGIEPNLEATVRRHVFQEVAGKPPEEGPWAVWGEPQYLTHEFVEVVESSPELVIDEVFEFTFEIQVGTGEYREVTRTVEEALTPGWYSDVWANKKIGKSVYLPLLGVDAITDSVQLGYDAQNKLIDRAAREELQKTVTEKGEFAATESSQKIDQSDVPGTASTMSLLPGSIEEAIDSITVLYGLLKAKDGDIHEFIRQYTRRPIATMEQILGSQNLVFDDNGDVDSTIQGNVIEGFHSRAFGDYNVDVQIPDRKGAKVQPGKRALVALFPGVKDPGALKRPDLTNRGKDKSAIKPELDPRGRARARVKAYVQELTVSRGLLG